MSLQRSSEKQRDQKRLTSVAEPLAIGQLAHLTGIHAKAIRYYESIGVLPQPTRQSNGYRRYGHADVNRLILLRRLRLLGVPLTALTPLLIDTSDARCVEVQHDLLDLVKIRLEALDQEIAELHLLRDQVIPSGKGMSWYTHNCVDNLRALPLPSLGIDPGTWKSRRHAKYGSVGFQPPMRETPASTGITVTGFGLQPPPEIRSNRQLLGCHCPRWEPSTARCSPISPGTCPEATQERARAPRLPSLRISRTGDGS